MSQISFCSTNLRFRRRSMKKIMFLSLLTALTVSCSNPTVSGSTIDSSTSDNTSSQLTISEDKSDYQKDYAMTYELFFDNGNLYKKLALYDGEPVITKIEEYELCCAAFIKCGEMYLATPSKESNNIELLEKEDYLLRFYVKEKTNIANNIYSVYEINGDIADSIVFSEDSFKPIKNETQYRASYNIPYKKNEPFSIKISFNDKDYAFSFIYKAKDENKQHQLTAFFSNGIMMKVEPNKSIFLEGETLNVEHSIVNDSFSAISCNGFAIEINYSPISFPFPPFDVELLSYQ